VYDLTDFMGTFHFLFLPVGSGWMAYSIVHRCGVRSTVKSIVNVAWGGKVT